MPIGPLADANEWQNKQKKEDKGKKRNGYPLHNQVVQNQA
jgi:hypothetical protein